MKQIALALFGIFFLVSQTNAQSSALFNGGELEDRQCSKNQPIIDVRARVVNDADITPGNNVWAFDDSTRTIKVWETGNNSYCVLVKYIGTYNALAVRSPGGRQQLLGNESGIFEGGYRASLVGTLKENPAWTTKGIVDQLDYQCSTQGVCLGYVNWVTQYFSSNYNFEFEWWGWKYQGIQNNTWEHTVNGERGDII